MSTAVDPIGSAEQSERGSTHARLALEQVCSGRQLERVGDFYRQDFVDHVNDATFYGLDGARQSVELYRRAFPNLAVEVEHQVAQGDAIASRWIMRGTCRGRRVAMRGITISHLSDGKIAEDWSYSDTVGLLRQLGLLRSAMLGVRWIASSRRAARG